MPVPLCLYGDVGIEVTGKMPVPLCLFGLSEALARGWVDEGVGFGVAGGFHGWAVPVDVFLETEGDDAGEADFGEMAAVVEVGEDLGPPRMASIHSSIWPLERGMDSGMALAAAWAPNHEKRASSFMRMAPSEFQRPHWS